MAPSNRVSHANSSATTPSDMSLVENHGRSNGRKSAVNDEDSVMVRYHPLCQSIIILVLRSWVQAV